MKTRNFFLTLSFILFAFYFGYAQEPKAFWENEQINEVNREPMHTHFFAYENESLAVARDMNSSANYLSLNGNWKFKWVPKPADKPEGFWKTNYDDKNWTDFPVPADWELHGYGFPIYTNVRYDFDYLIKPDPPKVPHQYNPVGSYRKIVNIPASWNGKKIYAHFDGVRSAFYVWVNGQWVGYSEDSKLAAEFDITKYIKPGQDNLIAFQVYRWSDGTYVEDQDMWRVAGVSRDLYLYARNEMHIRDIQAVPGLTDNYRDGILSIKLDFLSNINPDLKNYTASFSLKDEKGKIVKSLNVRLSDSSKYKNIVLQLKNPKKWTAETPNLYTLYTTLKDNKGKTIEVIPTKTGFRRVEIKNGSLLVNGQAILIKGVDRHEMTPKTGQYVSHEQMEEDIKVMKENNINAVRTSHYPNDPYWLELCDKYGLYVVDEANLESHGMGYGDQTLAIRPEWYLTHLQRNERMVQRDINHPSVIIWSMGNEAGMGENFEKVYHWVKKYDPSRPVQYERAGNSAFTDLYVPMYPSPKQMVDYVKNAKIDHKPFIMCEYAHSMGNSVGGFKNYWDTIRTYYPKMQGGFIWDFVDQSFQKITDVGDTIWAYGGDYGVELPSDQNFNDNGLLLPDRTPHPQMHEVRYHYQNIHTRGIDPMVGKISIHNENFFKDLSDVYLEWEVVGDGEVIQNGKVDKLDVAPQTTREMTINFKLPRRAYRDVFLNVYYKLKAATRFLPADYIVAKDQVLVTKGPNIGLQVANNNSTKIQENKQDIVVSGDKFSIVFDRQSGLITSYKIAGKELLENRFDLRPNFWRAPTDNDYGANFQNVLLNWKRASYDGFFLLSYEVEDVDIPTLTMHYDMPDVFARLDITYRIGDDGSILIAEKMKADPSQKVAMLPRFGMQLVLGSGYDNIQWYGRGPVESYWDRKDAQFVGKYQGKIADQLHRYVRPQESGNKTDLRWIEITGNNGSGIRITSDTLFEANALHYLTKDLDDGHVKLNAHPGELRQRNLTELNIDLHQMGVGGINSWGTWPLEEYRLPYQDYQFRFKIEPIK